MRNWKQVSSGTAGGTMVEATSSICNRCSRSLSWRGLLFFTVALGVLAYPMGTMVGASEPKTMKGGTQDQPLSPPIGTLWYNGDWIVGCNFYGNGLGFHYNGVNTHVHDDFVVPSSGWHL